jgi:hypothetical protein
MEPMLATASQPTYRPLKVVTNFYVKASGIITKASYATHELANAAAKRTVHVRRCIVTLDCYPNHAGELGMHVGTQWVASNYVPPVR